MKQNMIRTILIGFFVAFVFSASGRAEEPVPSKIITWHTSPSVGVGYALESLESEEVTVDRENVFALIRLPVFRLPKIADLSSGVQVEISDGSPNAHIWYKFSSFIRAELASLRFGTNVYILDGTDDGTSYSFRVTPVVGVKLATILNKFPLSVEAEFLGKNQPLKIALVATWD